MLCFASDKYAYNFQLQLIRMAGLIILLALLVSVGYNGGCIVDCHGTNHVIFYLRICYFPVNVLFPSGSYPVLITV